MPIRQSMTMADLVRQYTPLPEGGVYIDSHPEDCRCLSALIGMPKHFMRTQTNHPDYASIQQSILLHRLTSASHDPEYGVTLYFLSHDGVPFALIITSGECNEHEDLYIFDAARAAIAIGALKKIVSIRQEDEVTYISQDHPLLNVIDEVCDDNYVGIVTRSATDAPRMFHLFDNDSIPRDDAFIQSVDAFVPAIKTQRAI